MSDIARRLSSLSTAQLALLKSRLQKGESADSPYASIPRVSRNNEDSFPLSFAQERLLFFDQLQPGTPMYNIPCVYNFDGPLNVNALKQALNEIIRRHETTRTTFTNRAGELRQVISSEYEIYLPELDLSAMPERARDLEAQRLMTEEAILPFDLHTGPLLRATLLRLADFRNILLVTMHHIISDAWSVRILIKELTALYDAYSAGCPSALSELPIQYVDFAIWQRKVLNGTTLERHLTYWKEKLEGAPTDLAIEPDRPRPAVQSFQGAIESCEVPPGVTQKLKSIAQDTEVTLFMLLLAAFKTLLYRYSGREDQVVGTLIANRNRTETEKLIGFFVNTLVLRTRLGADLSFRSLLSRVKEVTLGAYAHQDMPFEKLVEELQPERNTGQHPLFQVLCTLQNVTAPDNDSDASTDTGNGTAKFDIALFLAESGRGLLGSIEYNTDLFEADTIKDMLRRYITLLTNVAESPDLHLLDIPLDETGDEVNSERDPAVSADLESEFSFE